MDPLHKQINTAIKERGRPAHTSPLEGDALPCSRPAHCALRAIFDVLTPQRPVSRLSAPKLQARRAVLSAATTIESRQYAGLTPDSTQSSALGRRAALAFTLVESVVAIGLFAFVIVGIVGLFGTALERQRQASFETRAVILSQQVLSRIRAAQSDTNISFRRGTSGPTTESNFFHVTNSTNAANTNVFYYKGTEISGLLRPENYADSTFSFFPGYPAELDTTTIAGRIRAILTTNGTGSSNLYRVTIEVSEPANLPLQARRYTNTFATFATFPN